MSHVATAWAIRASKGCGLSPAAKLVLLHLADRHNVDQGCFPSQERLVEDCEVSRSNLNLLLKTLEQKGLIRRYSDRDEKTKRQKATRYKMAFEADFEPIEISEGDTQQQPALDLPEAEPCPKIGHGAVSKNRAEPCPISGPSRVQMIGHDIEPEREPEKEPLVSSAGEDQSDRDFDEFWEAHPRPLNRDACHQLFREAVQAGENANAIVEAARRYAAEQAANAKMYICQADNWLKGKRWRDHPTAGRQADAGPNDAAEFWAAKIREGAHVPATAIKTTTAHEMIRRGLVTSQDLARIGVYA